MRAQAQRAGPGRGRFMPRPVSVKAAGPASPRMTCEEVTLRVTAGRVEAAVTLSLGSERFTGRAQGRIDDRLTWKTAAAATVAAIQHYLQQTVTDPLAPCITLVDLATGTTGLGRDVIHATVTLVDGDQQTQLLGSALVRNNWYSTAVAAALDAVNRQISLFAPPRHVSDQTGSEHACVRAAPEVSPPPAHVDAPRADEHAEADARAAWVTSRAPAEEVEPEPVISEKVDLTAEPAPRLPAEPTHSDLSFEHSPAPDIALGIEIGATSVRAVAVDPTGKILADERRPSRPTAEPELTLGMAVDAARAVVISLNSSANRMGAVGVTMPGRLRLRDGVCVSCGDFPSWREVPISQTFLSALNMPVSLIGAAEAAALAESHFGAAQGLSSLLFVTAGIELSIAVVAGGKPLMIGEAAPGQAGHMVVAPGGPRCSCGEAGCWQAVAGRDALVARVVRDIGSGIPSAISAAVENRLSAVTPALICQMATIGDNVAKSALEETGRFLALGIGNLITLFDPEAVILDSAPAPVASELRRATEMAMKTSHRSQIFSRCVLLSPTLGDAARVLGAAAWASQNAAHHAHVRA